MSRVASPAAHARPLPPGLVLVAAVLAIAWAGPLIRFATAPALAVSMWRLIISVAFIALVLALRQGSLDGVGPVLRGRGGVLALMAGLFLAAHFWSWIASLSLTTVASSVVLVNTQPIFVALLSVAFLGERPRFWQWMGIVVAVGGAVMVGWGDFGVGRDALLGDLLAVAGALFASCYYVIGRRLRRELDLWAYVGVVYGVAALALTAAVLAHPGVTMTGYPMGDWAIFLALAAGPMMIGHTGVNYALRYIPAYVANVAVLGEPIGATLIAWLLPGLREVPPAQTLLGGGVILGGIALTVLAGRGRRSPPAAAPG